MKIFYSLLVATVFITVNSNGQGWLNPSSPFKDPTPTPVWKTDNFIEIVYELAVSQDTTEPGEWVSANDFALNKLVVDFLTGSKTYSRKEFFSGPTSDGKIVFKINGYDFEPGLTLKKDTWKEISYALAYTLKYRKSETQLAHFANDAYHKTLEGNVSVKDITYNLTDKQFVVEVYSSQDLLKFSASKIMTGSEASIASFVKQSEAESTNNSDDNRKYLFKLFFKPVAGFDIVQYSSQTAKRVNVKLQAQSTGGRSFAQYEGEQALSFSENLGISDIKGKTVYGLNKSNLVLTTSGNANTVVLKFDESPFADQRPLEIKGISSAGNIFNFVIPNDEQFNYGKFKAHFEGTSSRGEPIENNSFYFTKSEITCQTVRMTQENNECTFVVNFEGASDGPVKLIFPKTGDTRTMTKTEGANSYTVKVNLTDDAIKNNLKDEGSNKFLFAHVSAFGKDYRVINDVKVIMIDTKKAVEDLEKISGGKNKKKEQIKKYLADNNFEGNTGEMTDAIFAELGKNKTDRNWSETWKSVGKWVKPAIGLLTLLI